MGQLGTPGEYEAWIIDSDTEERIYRVPWNSIKWQRTRNNVSVGSVFVAETDRGRECCGLLADIFPWSRMLSIERDGEIEWDGPITGWGRPAIGAGGSRGVTVRAHDRLALTWKRIVTDTENLEGDPTSIVLELLTDALFGTGIDPYTFLLPEAVDAIEDVLREYRADRIERIFDAMSELATGAGLFFTQHLAELLVNEAGVRDSLGGLGERPKLHEQSVVDLPGFDVDGVGMTTVSYVGGAGQGPSGFPRIGVSSIWAGEYLTGTLEGGRGSSRATRQYDLDVEAIIDSTRSAAPSFTLEQTPLSPRFGGHLMDPSLSNLLPGCLLDVDFEDTCGFDVPFLDVGYVYRVWVGPGLGVYKYQLTPLRTPTIQSVRIEQLDFNVTREGGLKEEVMLSAVPYAEWDGTLPVGWPTPPWEIVGGLPEVVVPE